MAEIEHVHQAEHQRQPGGHDEDHHAHRQAGDGQRDQVDGDADQRRARTGASTGTSAGQEVDCLAAAGGVGVALSLIGAIPG